MVIPLVYRDEPGGTRQPGHPVTSDAFVRRTGRLQ